MKLTGKAKEDFEKWYEQQRCYGGDTGRCSSIFPIGIGTFKQQHNSMQYGVYVDWFDSVGLNISLSADISYYENNINKYKMHGYHACIENENLCIDMDNIKTRQEARAKAILKANEIYNEA